MLTPRERLFPRIGACLARTYGSLVSAAHFGLWWTGSIGKLSATVEPTWWCLLLWVSWTGEHEQCVHIWSSVKGPRLGPMLGPQRRCRKMWLHTRVAARSIFPDLIATMQKCGGGLLEAVALHDEDCKVLQQW